MMRNGCALSCSGLFASATRWLARALRCRIADSMEHASALESSKHRQALRSRLLWFLAGAALNYLLIATPFKYLRTHTTLPVLVISACSIGFSMSFFFTWNYFVNFRTAVRKREALVRERGRRQFRRTSG